MDINGPDDEKTFKYVQGSDVITELMSGMDSSNIIKFHF